MLTSCFRSSFFTTNRMLRRNRSKARPFPDLLRRRITAEPARRPRWDSGADPRGVLGCLVAMLLSLLPQLPANASSSVRGPETVFKSPSGAAEKCLALSHMPGGDYSPDDVAMERALCSIDFYGTTHALCPKVFSTSPGTLVFDLSGGPFAGDPARFEREACGSGGVHKRGASAHVPVAVFRSIDRREHSQRVSAAGVRLSTGKPGLAMNHSAWLSFAAAEQDPGSCKPTEELFTPDGQLYGVMLHQASAPPTHQVTQP